MCSCVGKTSRTKQARRACCPGWVSPPSAPSTLPRRSGSVSTRLRPARASTGCRSSRGCRSGGRSTLTAGAPMRARYLLLRPPDPHLPGPERSRGLRARDRRQGQRAGAGARGAAPAVVEGRARRAGHQHRPLPVGRGALPADGGDLGGDAGLRQPVLGADQVAAPAPRHRADEADLRADRVRRQPLDPDPGGEGLAGRPSRTPRIRASGSRRSPSCAAPGSRSAC